MKKMTDYTTIKYLAKNCSIEVNVKCLVICYSYYYFPPAKSQFRVGEGALSSSSKLKLKY